MPQSNHQRYQRPSSSQILRANSIQSSSSRDVDSHERHYGENKRERNFRKENYAADEFIYKNKNKSEMSRRNSAPQYGSKQRPLVADPMCFIKKYDCTVDSLSTPNKAAPMKSMKIPSSDEKKKEKDVNKVEEEKPIDMTSVPMDWDNYHRLAVIYNFMDGLECEFPSLCTTGAIGKSLEGRDIRILKISNSEASNARVWIDAGIHAREWIAPAVNTFVANHIARNFDNMPPSVRNKDWYFLPVLNPDGYEYSHTTDRMWRKNKAYVHHTLYGVDLNRNFSFGWGGKGSSDEPRHSFYRGPRPFSEPETSAMRDVFMNSDVTFTVYITLHSFGQVIIMPFAYREELAPDYIRLLEGATVMSKAIYNTNGNTYKVGISKDVMYHASGTSNDWSHGEVGIPFCYLIELRSKKHKFKVPKEEIGETGLEILNCVVALMEFIDNYKTPDIEKCPKTDEAKEKSDIEEKTENETENQSNGQVLKKQSFGFNKKSVINTVGSRKGYPIHVKVSKEKKEKKLSNQAIIKNNESESSSDQANLKCSSNETSDCLTSNVQTVKVAYLDPKTQVWEVHITDEVKRFFVKSLNIMGVLDIWKEHYNTMEVMVEGSRAGQLAGLLHEKDINYSIAMPDVNTLFEIEQAETAKASIPLKKMDWKNYHRLETIYEFMDNLAKDYPYICQVSSIGKTIEDRDIKMLKISNGNENNIGVWLDGTIHAREWISGAVVTYMADQICRHFNSLPDSVTTKDWYIVPVVNPDGYEYTHTTDRMWRKNRTKFGECVGVDLNRNWGHAWGEKGEEGSSEDPGSIYFRGPKPFSERETAAIKHVIHRCGTKFQVFLSLHCYGETIIFPWGYTTKPCPDYVKLLEGGTAIAKGIHATTGYTYKVGSTKDMMYFSAGTSIDWSYGNAKIPYSYMIELRGKEHRFLLPKEFIIPTATEVFNGVLNLLNFISDKE